MKRMLFAALALVTVWSLNACSDADMHRELNAQEELSASKIADGTVAADAAVQSEAVEKYTKLIASFGTTKNRFQEEVPDYPDYYGGAHVTPQGELTILIAGDLEHGSNAVRSIAGSGKVAFKAADYSYAQLSGIMDELNDFAINKKNPAAQKNFNIFSLMDQQNRVVVELNEYSDAKIAEFKSQVLNSPAITFVKSKGQMKLEVDLNPGCKADLNAAGTNFASYGFRARRNSDLAVGMVTAGHAIGVGQTLYQGGTAIGTCSASQVAGSADAAFVPITNPLAYVPSNILCSSTSTLSNVIYAPPVGSSITKLGVGGSATGSVLNINTTWVSPFNGNTLTNMTRANYISSPGDSGALIYGTISSANRPAGIHTGELAGDRYFTKAAQITSALGLTIY